MAVWKAAELKDHDTGEFPVEVGGKEVIVRRPDLQMLVLKSILPTPVLNDVVKLFSQWIGQPLGEVTEDVLKSNEQLISFVDMVCCEVMVSPRMVQTETEKAALAAEGQDDVLIPTDVLLGTRRAIALGAIMHMQAERTEVVAAATEFRQE